MFCRENLTASVPHLIQLESEQEEVSSEGGSVGARTRSLALRRAALNDSVRGVREGATIIRELSAAG